LIEEETKLLKIPNLKQASRKSFALAGRMDRIEKCESKINPDNPVNPV